MTLGRDAILASALIAAAVAVANPGQQGDDGLRPSWLDRLQDEDRGCLDRSVGYAPPAFPGDLVWFNSEPLTWKGLRGRVVIIQSWTSKTAGGRNWALSASRLLAGHDPDDVQLIALHTPAFLDRREMDVPVALDRRGTFCDELGVFERPVNVVIDRNGTVRYAGLSQRGLQNTLALLVGEPHDPNATPKVRPADVAERPAEFPPIRGGVGRGMDFRGRRAPEMYVSEWLNGRPDARGKVVVIDFWATSSTSLPTSFARTWCASAFPTKRPNASPRASSDTSCPWTGSVIPWPSTLAAGCSGRSGSAESRMSS
ncbi:MAG: thioredoxin domain-containing protein [Planctomycetota bacterium]